MAYFFQVNPQRRVGNQWNPVRRPAPWGRGPIPQIVLHTFEWPPDRSVMSAASFLLNRTDPGSYHTLAGGGSERDILRLAPVTAETWHCIPSNKWSSGISATTYASQWGKLSATRRRNFVHSMAYAAHLLSLELIAIGKQPVPAKSISRDEAMRGVWGFTYHRTMDPGRRTDPANPAAAFPWNEFLTEYRRLMGDRLTGNTTPINVQEDDVTTEAQMRDINRWIENIHKDIKETLPALAAEAVWTFVTTSESRSGWTMLRRATDAAQATNAALPEIAGKVGASIDTDELAAGLAGPLTEALAGSVSGDVVESALRRVFADAATKED